MYPVVTPPKCANVYNLFYPTDPISARLEPLLIDAFQQVSPVKIPRYHKLPLGDGTPIHIGKWSSIPRELSGVCLKPINICPPPP